MKIRNFKSNRAFEKFVKELTNSTYIPANKEEILNMEYIELKCRMMYNMAFYNAAIVLIEAEVAKMVNEICSWCENMEDVRTLGDLLNSEDFRYGGSYESARREFVTILLEHLPTLP